MMVSMPAVPLHKLPIVPCGRHEDAEEGSPHAHRRWMTTIHRRQAKTWPNPVFGSGQPDWGSTQGPTPQGIADA